LRAFEQLALTAERRPRPTESGAVGAEAYEDDRARPIPAHLRRQALCAADELAGRQLVGCSGRAIDEVGEAAAMAQQPAILRRVEKARREAGTVQGGPEPVAGPREVKAGRGRIEARVDAAEEDDQARREDVAQALAARPREIGGARPA
jgi:hypothetical protein